MKRLTSQEIASLLIEVPDHSERKSVVQAMALTCWVTANGRGTFEGATGTGKSKVGVKAVERQFEKNSNSIVYILTPTQGLRDYDWPDEFRKWGAGHLIPKIRFLCHSSMEDEKVNGEIDLVVFDECHNATLLNCIFFDNNTVWNVLGLTATLPRENDDPDKFKLLNRLCPSVFKVPLEDAIALKMVSEFEVKVLLFDLDDTLANIPSGTKKKPVMATELGHYKFLTTEIQRCIIKKLGPVKFKYIGERARFLYNLPTRTKIAKDVMKHLLVPGKRTIIFCGSIDQCEELCAPNTYHSKTNDTALQEFKSKIRPYLGAVNALNEGRNLPEVDQSLVAQLSSSDLDIIQRIGRLIRWREDHIGLVAVLVAKGTVDEKWYAQAFSSFDKKRIKEYHIKPEV